MTSLKVLFIFISVFIQFSALGQNTINEEVTVTHKQARALQSLNEKEYEQHTESVHKAVRLNVTQLKDSQGQVYIGAIVSRAELLVYLTALEQILGDEFKTYRALQAARDHQLFHMTILSPKEYQLADKSLVEKLLAPGFNSQFSSQLNVTLLGLGKVDKGAEKTFFVVAQSSDAQLIRQRFLLKNKDFHITLGFNPNDIYGVKKDVSTLIK
jgi:hypothetical protein